MKKILSFLFVALGLVALASCSGGNNVSVDRLQISGQNTEFVVGDAFEAGQLVVTAILSDGSQVDVSEDIVVTEPANLNAPGTYAVLVSYDGFTAAYQINVNPLPVDPLPNHESIAAAIEAAQANAGKVNAGLLTENRMRKETATSYTFGASHFEYHDEYESYYYGLTSEGEAYGLYSYESWDGPAVYPIEMVSENSLKGLSLGKIMNNYDDEIIGAEGLLAYLYELSSSEHAQHAWEQINACQHCELQNSFEFGFEVLVNDYYFYIIDVEFVLDCEEQAITLVEIKMDGYYYNDLNGYEDEDYIYHYELDEEGNYVLGEDIAPQFTYDVTIEQELGERTAENPYPYEKCYYQSFGLEDAEGNKVTSETVIEAKIQENVTLTLVDILPAEVISGIDTFRVSATDANGWESYSVYGSESDGVVSLKAYKAGEYTVSVSSNNASVEFTLKVNFAELTSFVATDVNEYGEIGYEAVESITVYAGVPTRFAALVNDGANNAFTAALSEANENVTLESYGDYYEFSCETLGSYKVILTSSADDSFTAELTIEVVEAPSVADILNGTYTYSDMWNGSATYVFAPAEEGATNGTLTITDDYGTYEFTYSYEEGYVQAIPANEAAYSCNWGIELDASFTLLATYYGWAQGELTRA